MDRERVNAKSALQSEPLAVLVGIKEALILRLKKLIIEGDNPTAINSLKNTLKVPWEISNDNPRFQDDISISSRKTLRSTTAAEKVTKQRII